MAHLPNDSPRRVATGRPARAGARGGPLRLLAAIAEEANGSAEATAFELDAARQLLFRRAGDRALELPAAAGRHAVRVEALLAEGPTAIDPGSTGPASAGAVAAIVLAAATELLGAVEEEAPVLGDALFADLDDLTLGEVAEVAAAVLELDGGVRPVQAWGTVAGADAAARILQLVAPDLRAAAASHTILYQRFTEAVWQVPDELLEAGCARWRVRSRSRLRRRLRTCSRTGRLPGRTTAVARQILAVRADRDRLAASAEVCSEHLDHLDRGPLTDVDAVLAALDAVRRLQAALGGALDEARLRRLLLADAFRSPLLQGPAAAVSSAIRAWSEDVLAAGGDEHGALRRAELARWADECRDGLPMLQDATRAAIAVGADAPTLRGLVDTLLLREYVEQRAESHRLPDRSVGGWGAS